MRIVAIMATLASVPVAAVAQNQNQAQPNQNQAQQQNQQTQPQQKKSFWQKMQSMSQGAQNTMQNGTNTVQNTVQQGTNTVQGTMQNGTNVIQNGTQQGVQGLQQGTQFGAGNGNGGNGGGCGPSCFDAGPFQANISQMTMSQQGGWHIIRMNIQFHNATNQPLAIAYHEGSMVMVDNNGNTYIPAGGNPGEVQGMGIDRGSQTDSQFVLGPGQTGNALYSVARVRGNDSAVGTGYSYNFTIDELQAQNGAMAIPVRTYNLNFPTLTPSTVSSSGSSFPAAGSQGNGYVAGGKGAAIGTATGAAPGSATQQGVVQGRAGTAASVQQRMVNGRLVPVTPTPAANTTGVNNATMRSTAVPTTASSTARTVATAPAAKPTPVVSTTKTTAPPAKKTTTTAPH